MIKKIFIFSMAALLVLPCFSKTPREKLLQRLQKLEQKGVMYGHQDDPFYGTTWSRIHPELPYFPEVYNQQPTTNNPQPLSDTYLTVGDYPAVMGFDLGGIELADDKNLDGDPFEWIREEIRKHYERGGIITISWHPRNPLTGGSAWDVTNNKTVQSILPGGEKHELFLLWMQRVKDFLSILTDSKNRPIPYILRPWHEYNGKWFWWGDPNCTKEEFRALWDMFQDYICAGNAESRIKFNLKDVIVWSCSPNLQGNWTMEKFHERWPEDTRVDIVGEDCYQWGTTEDFISQTTADLDFLTRYAADHGMIFAITECGYQNSPNPNWWTGILKPIIDRYTISYILPWRNYYKDHFGFAPDICTKDDAVKFYKAKNTLFLRDIK